MLLRCLWRYVETSCHKHFVVVRRHHQTPPLTTSDKCHNVPLTGSTVLITSSRSQRWQHALLARNRNICLSHLHSTLPLRVSRRNIAMTFCTEKKLEQCGYTRWWKTLKIRLFVLTESTNVTDGRTDTQTPHACIGRARTAKTQEILSVKMTSALVKRCRVTEQFGRRGLDRRRQTVLF